MGGRVRLDAHVDGDEREYGRLHVLKREGLWTICYYIDINKDVNMCKIICELCVRCDYNTGFTLSCNSYDPHLATEKDAFGHMDQTKHTSTNEIMFILCRMCMVTQDEMKLSELDSEHSQLINDVLENVNKENDAKLILITDNNGRIVHPMK